MGSSSYEIFIGRANQKDAMGWACGKMQRNAWWKPEKTSPLGRHRNRSEDNFNPLNAELNPTCHLLALLGAHHILHVSRLRVKMDLKE